MKHSAKLTTMVICVALVLCISSMQAKGQIPAPATPGSINADYSTVKVPEVPKVSAELGIEFIPRGNYVRIDGFGDYVRGTHTEGFSAFKMSDGTSHIFLRITDGRSGFANHNLLIKSVHFSEDEGKTWYRCGVEEDRVSYLSPRALPGCFRIIATPLPVRQPTETGYQTPTRVSPSEQPPAPTLTQTQPQSKKVCPPGYGPSGK